MGASNVNPAVPGSALRLNIAIEPLEPRRVMAVGSIPAVPSPAAHWTFDETTGTTAADASGNLHMATLGTGVTRVAGDVGARAIGVAGTAAGSAVATGAVVNTANSFTVSAWVRLTTVGGYQTVASISGTNVSGFYLGLRADTGTFAFTRLASDANVGATVAASTSTPVAGRWYHLVGVNDVSAGTITLYVDGRAEGKSAYTGGWQATGNTMIGQALYGGQPVDFVNGAIDDVAFYASALSGAQIAVLDQPAAYSFDDGTGTTAADVSGHGKTATLGTGAAWTTGRLGSNAITLNGTPTGVAVNATPVVNTALPFSVSAWVKLDAATGYQTFASIDGTRVSGFFLQLRGDTGKFALTRAASDSESVASVHADAIAAPVVGRWYNLVGVNDVANGRLLLYVDGTLQSSVAYTGNWQATGSTVVGAGKYAGNRVDFVSGTVDDVRFYNSALTANVAAVIGAGGGSMLNINTASTGVTVSPDLFSAFMEDINYGGEGGIYNDQIRNSGFNDSTNALNAWSAVTASGVTAALTSDATTGPTAALTKSGKLTITSGVSASARVGIANSGYFGVAVTPSTSYDVEFYAKASAGFTGPLTVSLESNAGTAYASATVSAVTGSWAKYKVTLTTAAGAPTSSTNRVVISTKSASANGATIWFGSAHVFPPSYKGATTNHLRPDLMEKLAAMKPAVFRVPGGNYLEGNVYADRFQWQKTIGPLENRPGHLNSAWGYWSSDGMGLDEYLQMAEEVGARPMLAVYAGYSLGGSSSTGAQLQADVTDAVNELHYVLDPVTTSWGAMRAANGHPQPYDVREVEVGNEDWFSSTYSARYPLFYDAIRAAFPQLKIVATHTDTGGRPYDILDEHYYHSPQWFQNAQNFYDSRTRGATKVIVGEYAANQGNPTNTMASALGDATFMLGMERNSDLVTMSMYAPIWANVNGIQWSPDLIGFNNTSSYGSPTYYAQSMLANYHGTTVVSDSVSGAGGLRTLVTRTGNKYYVTVINLSASANATTINLSGVTNVSPTATMVSMAADLGTDVNSIADPTNVAPVTSTVSGLGTTFTRDFAANSITILTFSAANGPLDLAAPVLNAAGSVKTHAGIDQTTSLPLTGTPAVEGRSGGITRLVLTFNEAVVLSPTFGLSLSSGTGTAVANGNQVIVSINGATNAKWLTITLNGVGDAAGNESSYALTAGNLVGDVSGNGTVDFNDFLALQTAYGMSIGTTTYSARADFDLNGVVNFNDFLTLQSAYGKSIS